MLPEERFKALGSEAHLLCQDKSALSEVQEFLRIFEKTLSRFDPKSELSRLNENPEQEVSISPLLERALQTALWAAEKSEGLIDPTVLPALQKSGYDTSWEPENQIPSSEMPRPQTRTARANPQNLWQKIKIQDNTIRRPVGIQIDLGGTGKGLAIDMIAEMWAEVGNWAVVLGGDLRLGGIHPREVIVDGPSRRRSLYISEGAVATSGTHRRAWKQNGIPHNHLRDPLTGDPVWGKYIQATALAPTAREAELLAKCALLQGSEAPLRENGGLLLDWNEEWMEVG